MYNASYVWRWENMDREEFDKLEVLDQVEYINNQLENNKSIASVCKDLKIGRSTIRDRFKKLIMYILKI